MEQGFPRDSMLENDLIPLFGNSAILSLSIHNSRCFAL